MVVVSLSSHEEISTDPEPAFLFPLVMCVLRNVGYAVASTLLLTFRLQVVRVLLAHGAPITPRTEEMAASEPIRKMLKVGGRHSHALCACSRVWA
jgi:hypothetical protein